LEERDLTVSNDQETALSKEPAPAKVSSRDKAAATDEAARSIIDAEVSARDSKTEKLRAMRLEREQADVTAPVKKKPTSKRRTTAS